jgi:hypothetical protein
LIDRVMDHIPPEMRVMAEGMRFSLSDEDRTTLDVDLCALFDAMVANDEASAQVILMKWNAPPQCYSMLQMALMANKMRDDAVQD